MYNPNSYSIGSRITNAMLPRVEDKISFLYLEYAKLVQDEFSVSAYQNNQKIIIPLAEINALLLGPGTSVSHAVMKNIADADCTVIWCSQDLKYIYSTGMISSEYSKNLILQAKCYADQTKHLQVVRRMYQLRYPDINMKKFSLQQMRGIEGKRVKECYEKLSAKYNVPWNGRNYDMDNWDSGTPINRFLSMGNSLLYGICHAAIITFGLSPGLGFIHNGASRSFVYDIADLYKEKYILPAAFGAVSLSDDENTMRSACRKIFAQDNLMKKIAHDLSVLFQFPDLSAKLPVDIGLWNLQDCVSLGKNYDN